MPFSIHTTAWSSEHRAFVVEEFIQNGGSPRHISTFQTQSTNKISGTALTITLGNFTNGHSTASRLLFVVPFFSLVYGIRTFKNLLTTKTLHSCVTNFKNMVQTLWLLLIGSL
jgi:hypothetical protein